MFCGNITKNLIISCMLQTLVIFSPLESKCSFFAASKKKKKKKLDSAKDIYFFSAVLIVKKQ